MGAIVAVAAAPAGRRRGGLRRAGPGPCTAIMRGAVRYGFHSCRRDCPKRRPRFSMSLDHDPSLPSEQRVVLRRRVLMLVWRAVALVALGLGLVGIALPVMPTVPFLVVSAWAASKGWPRFEIWLLNHRLFGPPVRQWRERGAVPRRAKWVSSLMMLTSAVGMQFFPTIPLWVRIGVPAVMLATAIWLWQRPDA